MQLSKFVRTGKNAVMLLAGTMTRMVASFAFVIYCADRLGVEGFGKYSIAVHFFELFLSLTATAVGILLTRDLARWPRHTKQLVTSALIMTSGLCFLAPPVMLMLGVFFNYSNDTTLAIAVASCGLIPAAACSVFEATFVARERAEFVTLGTAVESLLRIGLSFLVLFAGYGVVALISVLIGVRIVLMLLYASLLLRNGVYSWSFNLRCTLRFARAWRLFAGENWMATVNQSLDMLLISWISGETAAGLYSAAYKIVRLGAVVAKSYTTAIFPVMTKMAGTSRAAFNSLYRNTLRGMSVLALPAIAAIAVIPDRAVGLFFDDEYAGAIPVLQVLIWVLLIEFVNPFLSHVLFAQGKQQKSLQVAAVSLTINFIATYILVRYLDAVGAALGTIIGGMVASAMYLWFTMPKDEVIASAVGVFRVFIAAFGLALFIQQLRELDLVILVIASVAVYTPLLFVVGALRIEDIRLFSRSLVAK